MDKLTGDLVMLIFSQGQMMREKIRRQGHEKICSLSFLHIETLRYIRQEQKITMKQLAEFLHIAAPSATNVIGNLVKHGLIKRIRDRRDKRIVMISLTAKGARMMNDRLSKVEKIMKTSIARLTAPEKRNFIKILRKLAENN